MRKHTGGAWEAHKSGIYDSEWFCVAMRHPQDDGRWEHNAYLIAAAPHMLSVLEGCITAEDLKGIGLRRRLGFINGRAIDAIARATAIFQVEHREPFTIPR